jgi:ABC-type branched-subunit amino acid transport system substrate-binding protein
MRSRVLVRTRAVWMGAGTALMLAGCGAAGSAGSSAFTVSGKTLVVYASQPPGGSGGQAATDALDAEALALRQAGARAGTFTVRLVKLDGRELSDNARSAVEDSHAIAYLGELQPGTSQVSVEILNQQGVLEISPADTAVYLTQPVPPVSGSPTSYYPGHSTYRETFARVVPNSAQEAKALVGEMQAEHVSKLYVSSDGRLYGAALALEVSRDATAAGLTPASSPAAADGVFYGASVVSPAARAGATRALDQAAAANPSVKLFAPSGLYDDAFVAGLSSTAQGRLFVSSPGFLPQDLPPAGRTFVSDFKRAYGHPPAPRAIFGYEAMSALLYVLDKKLGSFANNRADVVLAFRALKDRSSAIGTYSITGGDPSIAPFIFGRVQGGRLVPFKFSQAQG